MRVPGSKPAAGGDGATWRARSAVASCTGIVMRKSLIGIGVSIPLMFLAVACSDDEAGQPGAGGSASAGSANGGEAGAGKPSAGTSNANEPDGGAGTGGTATQGNAAG